LLKGFTKSVAVFQNISGGKGALEETRAFDKYLGIFVDYMFFISKSPHEN